MNKRVLGILAVSRSFGDHSYKRYVTVRPYVQRVELSSDAEFVVLGCDGVFDVLQDEDVCRIVKENCQDCASCAEHVVQEAVDQGSTDNITVIVVGLKPVKEWSCRVFFTIVDWKMRLWGYKHSHTHSRKAISCTRQENTLVVKVGHTKSKS